MTNMRNAERIETAPAPGALPFVLDTPELLRVRVLPAEFARILGVSKQSVSRWIKAGKITLTFDGRIDVQRGVQQVLRNTDPGQLRARVLRQAVEDVQQLRNVVATAEEREAALRQQLDAAQARAAEMERFADRYGRCEDILAELVIEAAPKLRTRIDHMRQTAWERSAAEPGARPRATATTSTGETDADWIAAVAECEAAEAAEP